MANQGQVRVSIIKARDTQITKSVQTEALSAGASVGSEWITPPVDLRGLSVMKKQSSILPQCIRAYKNNIAGFGIAVRYKDDVEENPEMASEFTHMEELIEVLNIDKDTKEVFEDIIEARETYGISYLEVLRNIAGDVIGIEFIRDTPSIQKSIALTPYVEVEYTVRGRIEKRLKQFCKYKQTVSGKTVYFKEFGDTRAMDKRTGKYAEAVPLEDQANELLEFTIGVEPYGEVRWIGQVLGIDGSRKAEGLNNRYFAEGRHTPLMIITKGSTLTDGSFEKLQQYMDGIKGENGQHAFLLLEAANADNRTDMEGERQPDIEIKSLADILQKDELFQDYLDNNRRKIQSSFQLPDIYVGYTTDFNRATAQSAQEVTEEQVFQPERRSLAWVVNNKLFAGYGFKHVEAYFRAPDISNPEDLAKVLNIAERAGGLTPNVAKEVALKALGKEAEPYDGDWGDIPLAYSKLQPPSVPAQLGQAIQKAEGAGDGEIVAVLKEVRKALLEKSFTDSSNHAILKYSSDQPRDDDGNFASTGAGAGGGGASADGYVKDDYSKAVIGVKTGDDVEIKSCSPHAFDKVVERNVWPSSVARALSAKSVPAKEGRVDYTKNGTHVYIDNKSGTIVTVIYKGGKSK
jgi:PBSX family phage portal protein